MSTPRYASNSERSFRYRPSRKTLRIILRTIARFPEMKFDNFTTVLFFIYIFVLLC